jgi:hypothetical protein
MAFILRWLLVLILLAFVALMLAAAPLLGLIHAQAGFDLTLLSTAFSGLARSADWIEATLWYAAAAFFGVAVIRLVRRTQAFWMWLIGFTLIGVRWGLTLRTQEGGALGLFQGLTFERLQPALLVADPPMLQLVLLIKLLILGFLILTVDNADKDYWDKHGG